MAEAEVNPTENLDEEEDQTSRQRRERRKLQADIQQLKKSINKNDKARKKIVDSEIRSLEEAFEKRWANFSETTSVPDPPTNSGEAETEEKKYVSRKARRLANKDKRHAEAMADEELIDYDNQPDAIRRREESAAIEQQLEKRGLAVRSIASDGNCLFASIVDQTSNQTVRQLREAVANFLLEHRQEYEPFIENDYESYCEKLAKENVWGGQIELQACANLLNRSIEIIQGNGKEPIVIHCPSSRDTPIIITYHRYLYTNGEHYNSTTSFSE